MLVLCSLSAACARSDDDVADAAAPERANLVLISVDTLRADHLGAYGYERATSPSFDRLARQGVQFMAAFSPTSWTLPGHASMLTGLEPRRHGAVSWKSPIAADAPLLAEILQQHGYRTAGVVNGTFVKPDYGFDRGMATYRVHKSQEPEAHQAEVLRLLDAGGSEPFFYFLHYMRVHAPYRPPDGGNPFERPYAGERDPLMTPETVVARWKARNEEGPLVDAAERDFLVDSYDGAILAMDALLAEVLERLAGPAFADTYVILTSDHGEEFMEHDFLWHSVSLFDEVLRVPLMIRGPGVPPGVRVDAMASLVDVVPTALDLLGIEAPPGLDGRSLRDTWEASASPERSLRLRTNFPTGDGVRLGVRTPREKLVVYPEEGRSEYYRLDRDPAERRALEPDARAARLEETLGGEPAARGEEAVGLSADEVEQLRALGYLDLPPPEEADASE